MRGGRLPSLLVMAALLGTGCWGSGAEGRCEGTFAGRAVSWPIDDSTRYWSAKSSRYGAHYRYAEVLYEPESFRLFGADLELDPARYVDETNTPYTATFTGSPAGLESMDEHTVYAWQGLYATETSYGNGWIDPPGVPSEAVIRIDRLGPRFAGELVHRWESGDELRCTFDVP